MTTQSRRRFLARSAAAGLVLGKAPAIIAQPASGRQTVNLLGYVGAFKDIYARTVVAPFQLANPGINVVYHDGGNSVEMLGMLRSQRGDPQIDLAILDAAITLTANHERVFEQIPEADVPALAQLYPQARDMFEGYGPAFTFDHYTILYDKRRIPSMTALRELWEPQYQNQIAIVGPPSIVAAAALTLIVNHMEGADYRQSIDPAIRKLRELAPSVVTFQPIPDSYSFLLSGAVAIATGWNARSQIRQNDVPHLGIMLPAEGTVSVMDTINLVKGAKNRGAALAFMNHALSASSQAAFSSAAFYGPTNSQANLPPDLFARMTSAPDNLRRVLPVDWRFISSVREQWAARWRREIISASGR
jgi:putative spermidine/putrescine transport system substrate-binding protein